MWKLFSFSLSLNIILSLALCAAKKCVRWDPFTSHTLSLSSGPLIISFICWIPRTNVSKMINRRAFISHPLWAREKYKRDTHSQSWKIVIITPIERKNREKRENFSTPSVPRGSEIFLLNPGRRCNWIVARELVHRRNKSRGVIMPLWRSCRVLLYRATRARATLFCFPPAYLARGIAKVARDCWVVKKREGQKNIAPILLARAISFNNVRKKFNNDSWEFLFIYLFSFLSALKLKI